MNIETQEGIKRLYQDHPGEVRLVSDIPSAPLLLTSMRLNNRLEIDVRRTAIREAVAVRPKNSPRRLLRDKWIDEVV
jgi:hypothetical protein